MLKANGWDYEDSDLKLDIMRAGKPVLYGLGNRGNMRAGKPSPYERFYSLDYLNIYETFCFV